MTKETGLKQFIVENEKHDIENAIGALEMSKDFLITMKKQLTKSDNKNVQDVVGKWFVNLVKKIDGLYDNIQDAQDNLNMALEDM